MKQQITRIFAICEDVIYILLGIILVAVSGIVVYSAVSAFISALQGGVNRWPV